MKKIFKNPDEFFKGIPEKIGGETLWAILGGNPGVMFETIRIHSGFQRIQGTFYYSMLGKIYRGISSGISDSIPGVFSQLLSARFSLKIHEKDFGWKVWWILFYFLDGT